MVPLDTIEESDGDDEDEDENTNDDIFTKNDKEVKKYAFDPTLKIHQFRKKSDPKISYLSERRKTKDKILKDVLKKQNQVRDSENTSNQNEMYTRSTMVGRVVF